MARLVLPASGRESGFGLIETILALVLLLGALVATSSLVASGLKVGGNSRLNEVATDIASSVLDCSVQQGGATLLNEMGFGNPSTACASGGPSRGTVTKGGVTYTIEQEVAPGTSTCAAPQPGEPNELTVTEFVTWAHGVSGTTWWTGSSATNKLVQESSYASVPATALSSTLGEILVIVSDDSANGQPLVTITAQTPPTNPTTVLTAQTTSAGCALFATNQVTPGQWKVTATRTGWLDNNENASATWTGNVPAGVPTTVPLKYAQEGTIYPEYTLSQGNPPSNISSLPLSLYNSNLSSNPYVTNAPAEAYPFTSSPPSYYAVAGSCYADSIPDNSVTTDGQAVNLVPNGSAYPTFPLAPLEIAVTDANGDQLSGASVTASASTATGVVPDTPCATGSLAMPTLSLGTTCSGGGSCPVQTAYHRSARALPESILTSWSATSHFSGSRSASRTKEVMARSADVQQSPSSRGRISPRHRVAVDSHAMRSSDAKRASQTDKHRDATTKPVRGIQESPAQASRDGTISPTRAATSTTISSSVNRSVQGEPVTFVATVAALSPDSDTPTGTVTFKDGSTTVARGALNEGVASYTASNLALTKHRIAAVYGGDTRFKGSTSRVLSRTVRKASTTIRFASSVNRSVHGQPVTFIAAVAPVSPGSGTPTGKVGFKDGNSIIHTGWLKEGVAIFTTSNVTLAKHRISAVYGGDTRFKGSTSRVLSRTVRKARTMITLASSVNRSGNSQSVSFIASVVPVSPGSGTPTGRVVFKDGVETLHRSTLKGGVAVYTASTLPARLNHSISVVYAGNADFTQSVSGALSQELIASLTKSLRNTSDRHGMKTPISQEGILASWYGGTSHEPTAQLMAKYTPTVTVSSSLNPSGSGQSVTFTATVSCNGSTCPTAGETVTFYNGSTQIGTGTLNSSNPPQATLSYSSLSVATHTIKATYSGDSNFNSVSGSMSQVVRTYSSTTTVSASPSASYYGQSVTFTATVGCSGSTCPTAGDTVTFYDNGVQIGTGTLNSSNPRTATYSSSSLTVGTHTINASFPGDSKFGASTSNTLSYVVTQASSSTSVTSSLNPSVYGQSVTFTATVTDNTSGSTGTPTGTVTFYDNGTQLGTGPYSLNGSGVATYSTSSLTVGTHPITATYSGDTNFTTSTSSPALSQKVTQASSSTSGTSSLNPSVYGQSVTFTATVSSCIGSTCPTGTVTFYDGTTSLGTSNLNTSNPRTATYSTSSLTVGTHPITATYSGDTNFTTSTSSPALSQVVNQATVYVLSGLPYGYYLLGATYNNSSQNQHYASNKSGTNVVVKVTASGVFVNDSVNGSVNWVQVSAGYSIVVPVA